jgi:hypothetical protein
MLDIIQTGSQHRRAKKARRDRASEETFMKWLTPTMVRRYNDRCHHAPVGVPSAHEAGDSRDQRLMP